MKKASLGINGQPLWFKIGTKVPVAAGGSVACSLASGEEHILSTKWEMPVDKNTKVTYNDKYNLKNMFMDPANTNYEGGFNVEFKM